MLKESKITCSKCGAELNIHNEIKNNLKKTKLKFEKENNELKIKYNELIEYNDKIQMLFSEQNARNAINEMRIDKLKKELEEKDKELLQESTKLKMILEKIKMEKEELATKTKIENEQILNITKNVKDLAKQLEEQKQVINDLKKTIHKK